MSFPVTFPRNLPTESVSHLNDDYLSLVVTLDGVAYALYEVAIVPDSPWPPVSVTWVANPGPKTPTTLGRYVVAVRATGTPKPAICVGFLVIF